MNRTSIRSKITVISVAAVFVAILSIFAASFPAIHAETDRRSVEMMRLIGENTRSTLDEYFESIEQSVSLAANMAVDSLDSVVLVECGAAGSSAKGERTKEQQARLDAYISAHCEHVLKTFESAATHTNGIITYYYCISPEISTVEHGFFYSRVGKAGFVAQQPLDARTLDANDISHTTWYYTPIQRGRPSWVGPYTAHFLDEMWTCSYLIPIYSTGALIGVLGMDIPLDTLIEQVSSVRVYDTGFASLCDQDGHILYHPQVEQGDVPALSALNVQRELLYQQNSGGTLIRYRSGGEQRQMSFSTLRNGMKLVITAPVREINASWIQQTRVIALITVGVIAAFAFILMLAMRFITQPLQRLTAAAQRLADEDYDVALSYKSRDEIGMLTEAFIRMRDQIRSYIADLNRRINTDVLTGLPNMRSFFKLAEAERRRLREDGEGSVLLYFDLIGMKYYNRQYGFDEGDKLLREIGQTLLRAYGEKCICRYSEDHFAAVCGETGLEERLLTVIHACESANGGNSLPMRAGIYRDSIEEVSVSVACDRAKYACDKHRGAFEADYYSFDGEMLSEIDAIRYVTKYLDIALAEHWIKVYYQPIIRTVNGHICDMEALSRWVDPARGLLSPAAFIPVLESSRLIYRLDLYVLDEILEKMKTQQKAGSDFDVLDMVEEIRRRVDEAGIARDRLTIEITESVIGSDFDFMKQQIERFQALGFEVWMDDFGSGYSSLDVLQDIHFDLIKFDMRFMKRFGEGKDSKIILTDLVRMAIDLGIDTVCEGVETAEAADFLREIGCSKLQGYYYSRPIPFEEIVERGRKGTLIRTENPLESGYYAAIGRVNLYDLTIVADKTLAKDSFDTMPAGIMEVRENEVSYIRTNHAYRSFLKQQFGFDLNAQTEGYSAHPCGPDSAFMNRVRQCCESWSRVSFDGRLANGSTVHALINPLEKNPVTGASAVAIAVLSVSAPDESATYADIARALASDYYNIYVVDLDTDRFIEYSSEAGEEELAVERHGEHFFEAARRDTVRRIYDADREGFLAAFSRERVLRHLEEQGVFTASYRLIDSGAPVGVNMKITRMPGGNRIIIGISIADI